MNFERMAAQLQDNAGMDNAVDAPVSQFAASEQERQDLVDTLASGGAGATAAGADAGGTLNSGSTVSSLPDLSQLAHWIA